MNKQPDCYIVIPVYNEAKVIRWVIVELLKYSYQKIIIVDDGSSDGTYAEAGKENVTLIRHRINRGKGAAITTGIAEAKRCGASVVVTFDGDGQHDPRDIKMLIARIRQGYDVVLGSRFLRNQRIPGYKRIANYMANFLTYSVYGIWVNDSQSGLRAYSKKAYEVLDVRSQRYDFDTEVLLAIRRHHLNYAQIPVHVRYTNYSQNKENRQNVFSAILTMLKVIVSS